MTKVTAPLPAPLPIRTSRLTLRAYRDDDLGPLLDYYADPEVARFLLEEPWTREHAETQLALRQQRTGVDGPSSALALVVEHEGTVIGDVALWTTGDTMSRGEVGWAFNPAFGGRGFATEALRSLLGVAFDRYRMHRVVAQLDARNEPSARLCARVGMQREGHLRADWWSKGEWTDTLVYGLLQQEWQRP
ncbi:MULTISPECIES: GNAT family N-acetyltransferase [Isoptericola]|uniref:GNAT family N-acetyltransferase n=1 Tax=Isoptericola TaxID=254250 RepID=UPI003839DD29